LKEGWNEMIARFPRSTLSVFTEEVARKFGFNHRQAKKLFQCFDPDYHGMISDYEVVNQENFAFLSIWDPAVARDGSNSVVRGTPSTPRSIAASPTGVNAPKFGHADDAAVIGINAPALTFEFTIALSKEEYNEYLRRRRATRVTARQPIELGVAGRQPTNYASPPIQSAASVPTSPAVAFGQSIPLSPAATTPREEPQPRRNLNSKAEVLASPRQFSPQVRPPRYEVLRSPQGPGRCLPGQEGSFPMGPPDRPHWVASHGESTLGGLLKMTHSHE